MNAPVARSNARLRFIFGLKVKSKLSSVLLASRKPASFLRRSSKRSERRVSSSEIRHEIRSLGAIASQLANNPFDANSSEAIPSLDALQQSDRTEAIG